MTTRTTRSMSRQMEQLVSMPYAKKLESMEIDEVTSIIRSSAFDLESPIPADIVDVDEDESSKYCRHNTAYLAYLDFKQKTESGPELLAKCGIKGSWRTVLLDWLHDIVHKCQLLNDTFYLAVGLLDRYLDNVDSVPKKHVQKTGVVALFMAAKYEEIYPPSIEDLADMCDGAYTVQELLAFEIEMFAALNFDLAQPYALQFLRRFASTKKDDLDRQTYEGAKLLIELSILDNELIGVSFAAIAAAALKLSIKLCQPEMEWDAELIYWAGFNDDELRVLINHFADLLEIGRNQSTKKPMGKVLNRYKSRLASAFFFSK